MCISISKKKGKESFVKWVNVKKPTQKIKKNKNKNKFLLPQIRKYRAYLAPN